MPIIVPPPPTEFTVIPNTGRYSTAARLQQTQQTQQQHYASKSFSCTASSKSKIRFYNRPTRTTWTTAVTLDSSVTLMLPLLLWCSLALLAISAREPPLLLQGPRPGTGGGARIRLLDDISTTHRIIKQQRLSLSSSSTCTALSSLLLLADIPRGGSNSDSSDTTTTAASANLPDDTNSKEAGADAQRGQQPANSSGSNSNKFWPMGDLFRLYDTVKGEALSLEQQFQGQQQRSPVDHHNNKEEEEDSLHRAGRGGAVAVQEHKVAQPQQQPRGFSWFGSSSSSEPLHSTAPLSSRLLPEGDDDNDEEKVPTTTTEQEEQQQQQPRGPPPPASARWGNVGMQFVPDGVQDSELDFLDEEFDDDEEEEDNDDVDEELLQQGEEDDLVPDTSRNERGDTNKRSSSTRVNENEVLMEAISHLKPNNNNESNQQQQQQGMVGAVAEKIEEMEKEKYTKGAYIAELPLADASLTKEQEAALLYPDSASTSAATSSGDGAVSPYVSSGIWPVIDNVLTVGYAFSHPAWKLSRKIRPIRKAAAHVTGLHGVLSGKRRMIQQQEQLAASKQVAENHYKHLDMVKRRLASIDRARRKVHRFESSSSRRKRSPIFGGWFQHSSSAHYDDIHYAFAFENTDIEETQRRRRVQEIDKLMADGQRHLLQLATEKDILQKRPNPLWTYQTTLDELDEARRIEAAIHQNYSTTHGENVVPARTFSFPPKKLVDDYLKLLLETDRLVLMNHTDLWRNDASNADDLDHDDDVYDDDNVDEWFFGASSSAALSKSRNNRQRGRPQQQQNPQRRNANGGHYYYGNANHASYNKNSNANNGGEAGSFWLRNGIGEKIGEAVETAAYKAVCQAVMSFLARLLSSLHGINVMTHSDIRLYTEKAPELPGSADEEGAAFSATMRRGAKASNKKRRRRNSPLSDFIQRDAVVETLLSQSTIAAPLLKVFPLNWQRALLGNIVTLVTCVITDFVEGLEFQILGHRLSFAFAPITEEDMIRHLHMVGTTSHGSNNLFYHRRFKSPDGSTNSNHSPDLFEEAVRATALDLSLELNFLDKWHERALGGDMLKTQIATLIARLVLSLVDEILCGARMDLWTTHAGGPRLVAGLEYRHNNTAAKIPVATKSITPTATTTTTMTTASTTPASSSTSRR